MRPGNMNTPDEASVYSSSDRFDENRIRAAAIYCSDGRFGEQFDDFLHNGLELPRYDRLAVPGGAACLAGHFQSLWEELGLIDQFRFLLKVHGIERVVLIAHQDCAFYTERLRISPQRLEAQQCEDLEAAAGRVRSFDRSLRVQKFFARKCPDGTIRFEPIAPAGAASRW